MPAESYTPDPALVELVARAAYEADVAQVIGDEQLTWDEQPEQCHDWFRVIARAVLAALATEGRLLAADARAEALWAWDCREKPHRPCLHAGSEAWVRETGPALWPDGRLMRAWRAFGPWLPVPDTYDCCGGRRHTDDCPTGPTTDITEEKS